MKSETRRPDQKRVDTRRISFKKGADAVHFPAAEPPRICGPLPTETVVRPLGRHLHTGARRSPLFLFAICGRLAPLSSEGTGVRGLPS